MSNLDKVLYPETGFTKGEVIDYYARVGPAILPHLHDRPLTVVRFPDGVEGRHFFEKNSPTHRPDWVRTAPIGVGGRAGTIEFTVCDDLPTLVWLAQLAAIELHPSLARAGDLEHPTVLAFDLDPGEPATIVECCTVALRIRELFSGLGLEAFPKTSGSKGMQVYVPLDGRLSYATTKPYARAVALALERADPDLVTSRMARSLRPGRVFVDWSQNARTKTTVAAYSLRARGEPTASTPLRWSEVECTADSEDPDQLRFGAAQVLARLERDGDLFAPVLGLRQELPVQPGEPSP